MFPDHLTHHQHNVYQYNHAISFNITSLQATFLSYQNVLPPTYRISSPPSRLLTSPPVHNTTSFPLLTQPFLISHSSSLTSWAMTVFTHSIRGPPMIFSDCPGFTEYSSWNYVTTCGQPTNFTCPQVNQSYPVYHMKYCHWFWYHQLSAMLETWYSSLPATSVASGGITCSPSGRSSTMGSRSKTGCTSWICIDTGWAYS
jgi:hypothetical protein